MIIFVGVAGSGKSIQGKLLAQAISCDYFSMGEFLRDHTNPTIQKKMLTGELINDEEVISVIDDNLPKGPTGLKQYVLDGFPRTVTQVEWLIEQVNKGRFVIKAVIHLKAAPETIVPRLLERKRPDDHLEAINHRINEYNVAILPIIKKLRGSGIEVDDINAEQAIENVHHDILAKLKFA